jgi:hypothetical protein
VDSNIDVWDERLERQLNDYGIYSKSIKIKPGQALILPQGKFHCFKKINHHEPNQSSDIIIPMVSCACNASYVGVDNVIDNYYTIMVSSVCVCYLGFELDYIITPPPSTLEMSSTSQNQIFTP